MTKGDIDELCNNNPERCPQCESEPGVDWCAGDRCEDCGCMPLLVQRDRLASALREAVAGDGSPLVPADKVEAHRLVTNIRVVAARMRKRLNLAQKGQLPAMNIDTRTVEDLVIAAESLLIAVDLAEKNRGRE